MDFYLDLRKETFYFAILTPSEAVQKRKSLQQFDHRWLQFRQKYFALICKIILVSVCSASNTNQTQASSTTLQLNIRGKIFELIGNTIHKNTCHA